MWLHSVRGREGRIGGGKGKVHQYRVGRGGEGDGSDKEKIKEKGKEKGEK